MAIRKKTIEEIKKLAFATAKGEVFTSEMISKDEVVTVLQKIFVPLWVLSAGQIAEIKEYQPVMFYEYLSEAAPQQSVNGYPIFYSMRMLNASEFTQFRRWVKAYERAVKVMHQVLDGLEMDEGE